MKVGTLQIFKDTPFLPLGTPYSLLRIAHFCLTDILGLVMKVSSLFWDWVITEILAAYTCDPTTKCPTQTFIELSILNAAALSNAADLLKAAGSSYSRLIK